MAGKSKNRFKRIIKNINAETLHDVFGLDGKRADELTSFVDKTVGMVMKTKPVWTLKDIFEELSKDAPIETEEELLFCVFMTGDMYGKETFIQQTNRIAQSLMRPQEASRIRGSVVKKKQKRINGETFQN